MGVKKLLQESDPKKKIKELESLVESQARTIDSMRRVSVSLPTGTKRKRKKDAFVRVIFGDVHGEHMDKPAVAAFLNDVEMLRPAEVCCIGDLIDCGGFLSQHKTLGVVAELEVTYEQDVGAANFVLDEIQRRVPGVKLTLIEGNHENRINRWICDQVLGNAKNAEYLKRLFGPAAVLNLESRGVRFIERHLYYDGLSISGTCRIEPYAVAQHGEAFSGKYAAFRQLGKLGKSVFFGHSHRLTAAYGENLDGHIVSVNTGCLCELRPLYGLTKITDWTQGYVVQVILPSEGFIAIPVPVVQGVSYMQPLMRLMNV